MTDDVESDLDNKRSGRTGGRCCIEGMEWDDGEGEEARALRDIASGEYLPCRRHDGPGDCKSDEEEELRMPGKDWVLCRSFSGVEREYCSMLVREADFFQDVAVVLPSARLSVEEELGAGGRMDLRRPGRGW